MCFRRSAPPVRLLTLALLPLAVLPLALLPQAELHAQDVELLGEVYGTRPPAGYFETLGRDPGAFQFSREGAERLRILRESPRLRSIVPGGVGVPGGFGFDAARVIGPRDGPLQGTFRLPLVLGTFSDGPAPAPYSRSQVQAEFFDGPNSRFQTIPEFYAESSGGMLVLQGVAFDWVQTALARDQVTLNQSGLVSHPTQGMAGYIEAIVETLDAQGVDWSQFDMSGDGYVDVLAVMHPYRGAECAAGGTNLIWSHRWSLRSAAGGPTGRFSSLVTGKPRDGFETSTPYAGGGFIHINDYTVQPLLDCESNLPPAPNLSINRIGVFAHELGHAFGLPDLYPTGGQGFAGVGHWDLMATGAWGCRLPGDSARPCHLGAWSKAALGWVQVEEVGPDELRSVLLEPVLHSRQVLRIPAMDGSREYLLLENRQRIGSDVNLEEPGLLIWHVDQDIVDLRWTQNAVNVQPQRMGVRLVEADGQGNLTSTGMIANRGDPGDPFPGCIRPANTLFEPCSQNGSFHIGTHPAARAQSGAALGVALTGIELVGAAPHDVSFQLDTRFTWDTILVAQSAEAVKELSVPVQVSGVPGPVSWRFVSGTLPPGLSFQPGTTSLTGSTFQTGTFEFVLSAADGPSREVLAFVTLQVVPPLITFEDLVAGYLGITPDPLSTTLRIFLDAQGNQNGGFDLGDARAFIQAGGATGQVWEGAP